MSDKKDKLSDKKDKSHKSVKNTIGRSATTGRFTNFAIGFETKTFSPEAPKNLPLESKPKKK